MVLGEQTHFFWERKVQEENSYGHFSVGNFGHAVFPLFGNDREIL